MTALSDAAVVRLRALAGLPETESGRYTVVEEIGRGGMGTVYLALDRDLGREVAIKIPHTLGSAGLERRLQSEARVLARLEHPGIVPIHDVGRLADGRLFYAMKRVRGRTLREHFHEASDIAERLRVFERVLEPVAFAHARGVVHRDLKPDNVMVGSFGEVMVMDWGVAKAIAGRPWPDDSRGGEPPASAADMGPDGEPLDSGERETRGLTYEGAVIGTRGFMAPEQARGALERVDPRADIYSLGAILFLLLTDEVPGPELDLDTSVRRRSVPRPLAAICLRALAGDPAARYQTVAAFADDIARYRAGQAVDALPETVIDRAARFGRTYRTAILLVLAYLVMRAVVALVAR